jgi:uncharacterized protein
MIIGVISDTHGSLKSWQKIREKLHSAEIIVHCGDLFNHGPGNPLPVGYAPGELLETFNSLEKPFLAVKGNCDSEVDQMLIRVPLAYPFLFFQVEQYRIVATHGHIGQKEQWVKNCRIWDVDFLLLGHTHKWEIEKENGVIILNPGSTALPKNEPSFAFINTEEKNVKILNADDFSILKETSF